MVVQVFLVNPSDVSFGSAVITPRWLFVLAGATPARFGDPILADETIEQLDLSAIRPGDVVGIGIHTANVLRGLEIGRAARALGAWVVFGGIHATLYPAEPLELGGAHAVVHGDGDEIWSEVLSDCEAGAPKPIYDGGRVSGDRFVTPRWELVRRDHYMWASVQTVRGCAKHCSFCSVWRTDGQKPRVRAVDALIGEMVALRRIGFKFIALADDNFYPVTLTDIANAKRQNNAARVTELERLRAERFELMELMAQLPPDMTFFTQITMEAAEDPAFLRAMNKARIRGALVGVEAVTEEGLKSVYKGFNLSGDDLVARLGAFREHRVFVLGSFIFGLPSDRPDTFTATVEMAKKMGLAFAQFVMLTPYPGTVDFERWEREHAAWRPEFEGVPLSRYWLIPKHRRPKLSAAHPTMSGDEIQARTQGAWDDFYTAREIWKRSSCATSLKARVAFFLISKLYRQMYAKSGLAADSAGRKRANRWSRWMAEPCRRLFLAKPMPELAVPRPVAQAEILPALP